MNYIFGYGSLVDKEDLINYLGYKPRFLKYCKLNNFCRVWNVAMNNQIDLPSYKYYRNNLTKKRDFKFVTFLNIEEKLNSSIEGILFSVDSVNLKKLDERERNYKRININHHIYIDVKGDIWTYVGSEEGEKRYLTGKSQESIAIQLEYYNKVIFAFAQERELNLNSFFHSMIIPEVPIISMTRIDL